MRDLAAAQHRRNALRTQLSSPVAIFAGAARVHNYRANPLPFRAASHFLYLVGEHLEHAVLHLGGDSETLYLPSKPENDDLWHGPTPDEKAWSQMLGLTVRFGIPELRAATLPCPDAEGREQQQRVLGRAIEYGHFVGEDRALAHAVVGLRMQHDEDAQQLLQASATIACQTHRVGISATRNAQTESDVESTMHAYMIRAHAAPAYIPIVTIAGEVLHNHAYANALNPGDLLLADVGAETRAGFASDITRTWPVSGVFSSTQREIYQAVWHAQQAAIARATIGTEYADVHRVACVSLTQSLVELGIFRGDADELVADGVHALFFPHGVGHLLGLDVHDMEDLGDIAGYAEGRIRSTQFGLAYLRLHRPLLASMAVTIEPGFYQVPRLLETMGATLAQQGILRRDVLARFSDVRGIRIEDDVLVTVNGPHVLTQGLAKTVAELETACATSGTPF